MAAMHRLLAPLHAIALAIALTCLIACNANPTPHPGTGDQATSTGDFGGGETGDGGGADETGGADTGSAGSDVGGETGDDTGTSEAQDASAGMSSPDAATDPAPMLDAAAGDAGPQDDVDPGPGPLFTLGEPTSTDESGDELWAPGETLTVTVSLTNSSGADYSGYPGVQLDADVDHVTIEPPVFTWYAIFVDETMEAVFTVTADDDAPAGDVTLTAQPHALNCETSGLGDCPSGDAVELTVTITP